MKLTLGIFIWLIILLFLSLPLILLSLWKWLVIFFCSWRRNLEEGEVEEYVMHPLAAADSMLTLGSSWEKPIVNTGFILKFQQNEKGKRISVKKLREHFSKCFLTEQAEGGRYERLFSYLVIHGAHAFRNIKKRTALDEQIVEVMLDEFDQQGNKISVERFLAEWMTTGYKKNTPCWEMILISLESYQYLAFKIHHAQADGYSLLHILDRLTSNTSPYLVKDFQEGPLVRLKQLLEGPMNLARLAGTSRNPFSVKPSAEKYEWMVSFTSFPLQELKEIRKAHRVHIASVILTIMSGAIREFLKNDMDVEEIPEYIKVGNTLPCAKHPSRDGAIPNKDKLCNHWYVVNYNRFS